MHNATLWLAVALASLGGYVAGQSKRLEPVLVLESDKGRSPEFTRLKLEIDQTGQTTRYGWTPDGLRWVERNGRWFAQAFEDGEEL